MPQVEVHNEQGLVAAGNIPIADLWQVCHSHHLTCQFNCSCTKSPRVQCIAWQHSSIDSHLCSATMDAAVFGKKALDRHKFLGSQPLLVCPAGNGAAHRPGDRRQGQGGLVALQAEGRHGGCSDAQRGSVGQRRQQVHVV